MTQRFSSKVFIQEKLMHKCTRKSYTNIHSSSSQNTPKLETIQMPSADEYRNKLCYIHGMECKKL